MRAGVTFPAANRLGGVERIVWDFLRFLGPRHETSFVGWSLADASELAVRHIPVARRSWVPRALDFRLGSAAAVRRWSATGQISGQISGQPRRTVSFGVVSSPGDVYWVHSVHRAYLASAGTIRLGVAELPARVRRLLPRHQLLVALERDYFTRHRPSAIVCTSPREAADLEEWYGVPGDIVRVVPNGFDPELFSPSLRAARRDEMRRRLGIAEDDIVLLFVGNELHRKGFGTLLEAVALLNDPRVRIELVGKASPAPYATRVHQLRLESRVRWHGPTSDVAKFHAAGDVFVLPTTYEPFGLVILEALASGLPVITTRLAGAAPIVGEAGLLQDDPADVEELADLLRRSLEEARRDSWRKAAPKQAAPFVWDRVFGEVERILTAV